MSIQLGVLGHPIHHSLSPKMHQQWLKDFAIDGRYSAIDTGGTTEGFSQTIYELRERNFLGVNVTVPHKQDAYGICDHLSPEAKRTGAVNTLHFSDNNKIFGYNTDIEGFVSNIKNHSSYAKSQDVATALIMGAGGAMRSVLLGLLQEGFETIHIINRTFFKAENIVKEFQKFYPKSKFHVHGFDQLPIIIDSLPKYALVVNTTSLGLVEDKDNLLGNIKFSKTVLVTDLVYNPLITPFLAESRTQGIPIQDGFGMLMYQGAAAFRIWFGKKPIIDPSLRNLLLEKT